MSEEAKKVLQWVEHERGEFYGKSQMLYITVEEVMEKHYFGDEG